MALFRLLRRHRRRHIRHHGRPPPPSPRRRRPRLAPLRRRAEAQRVAPLGRRLPRLVRRGLRVRVRVPVPLGAPRDHARDARAALFPRRGACCVRRHGPRLHVHLRARLRGVRQRGGRLPARVDATGARQAPGRPAARPTHCRRLHGRRAAAAPLHPRLAARRAGGRGPRRPLLALCLERRAAPQHRPRDSGPVLLRPPVPARIARRRADDVWLPRALLPPRLPRARLGALLVRRGGVPLPALPAHADPRRAGHAQLDALHRAQLGGGARRRRRGASPAGLLEVERKTCFGFARRYSL
mmetsp:Transcript_981/g.3165  ORF Transcript_981/g.3165 Transcript_981/m.3165 type:complete len:298 (-) Transcript_981:10-903(-)